MITPDSIKSLNNANDNKNYKYTFKRDGGITQKPTNKGYDFAVVRKNTELSGLKGADNYNDFTKNRVFGGYKYDLGNSNVITDFNGTPKNKKSKKRIGTSFTVNDEKVADELYRVVAGNSNVEYGKLTYNNLGDNTNNDSNKRYDIWTEAKKGTISGDKVIDKLQTNNIIDYTHSHPFRNSYDHNGNFNHSMQIPSANDRNFNSKFTTYVNSYNNIATNNLNIPKRSTPTTHIYHPWSNDTKEIPYTNEFNESSSISDHIKSEYTRGLESIINRQKQ